MCRNAINRCFALANGNALLVFNQNKDKIEVAQTFASVSAILLTSLNGGGGSGTFVALSGDVTSTATGGATTINNGVVSNTKLSTMPALTVKGNGTGATAAPQDLTMSALKTELGLKESDITTTNPMTINGVVYAANSSLGLILTALNSQVTTNQTNVANLYSLSGVTFGATNLGTFTGITISDAATNKTALQQLETGLESTATTTGTKQDKVQFKQSGINVSTSGAFTKLNFIGATVAPNGGDATQADVTITSGATTNTLTAASSAIVSTVNGTAATLTPAAGTIAQSLGFNAAGALVTQSPSSGVFEYDAGGGCSVVATGTGVTFTRTTASVWTFVMPSGVKLLSHRIYSIAGENPGTNVTLTYNYTGNTLTNQGFTTARPPSLTAWNMQTGVYTQAPTGGSLAANFRPAISAVSGGNITILSTLGSLVGTGETLITGNF
jgi:hypothetical protein